MGKLRETSSRLLNLYPKIAILLETRVKCDKAKKVKDYLNLRGKYLDNYQAHYNGRIWIFWDDSYKDIKLVKCTSQMIHCGVYDVNGNFQNWMTAIYAMNQLDQRRKLWEDLEHIHNSQQGPWFLMGDFNNVTKSMDRVGGNLVTEREYVDLRNLMDHAGLFEKDSTGEYFTWTNKHSIGTIYSKIDHVLGNIDWLQDNTDVKLEILPPSISDHYLLCLSDQKNNRTLHTKFKFTNSVVKVAGYQDIVRQSWNKAYVGRPMVRLWYKLMRLQAPLIKLSKQFSHLHMSIVQARTELLKAQEELTVDRMNRGNIEKVKKYTDEVIYLQELNDNMLRQRTKLDWLREGDTNSAFFYAYLNSRNVATHISQLQKEDGTYIQNPADIEKEVCEFYGKLYGTREQSVSMIDINAMREGPQLTMVQRADLITLVTVVEIKNAIKGIGDLKSPGIDGYGGKFFKASWDIIEKDVVEAVQEFFEHNVLYKRFNETVVTLIPKHPAAKMIKEYRPIAGCSTFYKIISKILTTRLGRVLGTIISKAQVAFFPGQKIHSHILLAMELLKGYNRSNGTPRCMVQLDLQKAYDMVDWGALENILSEIGLPKRFVDWIMTTVTTVSYRFNINGIYTDKIEARRGIRQGDPLSPLLFVITMEYLSRLLFRMQKNPDFNHHTRCERLQLTHLTFADDLLLFSRGDQGSMEIL